MFEAAIKALAAPIIETEGYHWTTDYVLDLLPKSAPVEGKTYIITAGHSGIGEETTRALISRGANVIIGARNKEMADAAISRIKEKYPNANVKWIYLDLSDLATVRQFAIDFKKLDIPLHGIVCSAGIMATPYFVSKQGHEMQFATNHLGHHLLLAQLVDKLVETHGRIVTVSSGAYILSGVRFDDIGFKNGEEYEEFMAYGQSKTANILCAKGFNQRYAKDGVECFSVHPGKSDFRINICMLYSSNTISRRCPRYKLRKWNKRKSEEGNTRCRCQLAIRIQVQNACRRSCHTVVRTYIS